LQADALEKLALRLSSPTEAEFAADGPGAH